MATQAGKSKITIELTPEQQAQVQRATGKQVGALQFTAEELEDRIAPGSGGSMSAIQNIKG